eukprot:3941381-Rhodomonas_salina.1
MPHVRYRSALSSTTSYLSAALRREAEKARLEEEERRKQARAAERDSEKSESEEKAKSKRLTVPRAHRHSPPPPPPPPLHKEEEEEEDKQSQDTGAREPPARFILGHRYLPTRTTSGSSRTDVTCAAGKMIGKVKALRTARDQYLVAPPSYSRGATIIVYEHKTSGTDEAYGAARDLKLLAGPYKAARDAFLGAVSIETEGLFDGACVLLRRQYSPGVLLYRDAPTTVVWCPVLGNAMLLPGGSKRSEVASSYAIALRH